MTKVHCAIFYVCHSMDFIALMAFFL